MNTVIIEKDRFKNMPGWDAYFSGVEWTIKARHTDVLRKPLTLLSAQDGFLCCTDGHRLHLFMPDYDELPADCLLPDDLWEIKSSTKKQIILVTNDEGLDFPDYWRILDYKPHNGIEPMSIHINKNNDFTAGLTRLSYHINTRTGKMISLDYMKDALFEGDINFETDGRDTGLLAMGNGSQLAILMPLKQ